MNIKLTLQPFMLCALVFSCGSLLFAQSKTDERRPTTTLTQNQSEGAAVDSPATSSATEILASEIVLLRKSIQTLSTRLREVTEKASVSESTRTSSSFDARQKRVLLNLDILSRAEQRAEILRKQLIEASEKEISVKARLTQIEEDIRPENIERSVNMIGTTRAPELRDNRRRIIESERSGLQSLQSQIQQSRVRLENDVQQADLLVVKLRQKVLPVIDREIQSLDPVQ